MKTSILFLLLGISLNAAPTFQEFKNHFVAVEGIKFKPYKCSMGFNTVGIGHKFEKWEKIKSNYSNKEIDELFKTDLNEAKIIARKVFPTFDKQPDEIQILLVDTCFNMGESGIKKFVKFRAAIESKNYKLAAQEIKNSKYYHQTGRRAERHYQTLLKFYSLS